MSVQYNKELFNNGKVRLFVNFSNIKGDVADENMTLHFYATNNRGIPIFTETLGIKPRLLSSKIYPSILVCAEIEFIIR